jgi:hypothetical protein
MAIPTNDLMGSMQILQARYINDAMDKYKRRWFCYPANTDAFISTLFSKGMNLATNLHH